MWSPWKECCKFPPQKKTNLQALARVEDSIVALVGQWVPLTGSQRKKLCRYLKVNIMPFNQTILGLCEMFRLSVLDNVPIPSLEDYVLVKLKANIPCWDGLGKCFKSMPPPPPSRPRPTKCDNLLYIRYTKLQPGPGSPCEVGCDPTAELARPTLHQEEHLQRLSTF